MSEHYRPSWMTDEVVQLRDAVHRFSKDYLEPNDLAWRENKQATREAWLQAGELGLILSDVPEQYGGPGGTPAHCAVIMEEMA
jgi:acyl-CoA dehydrogenase